MMVGSKGRKEANPASFGSNRFSRERKRFSFMRTPAGEQFVSLAISAAVCPST
jgi:hypothetical protein